MEDYLQTEFTGLRAWLTSITEQWAVIAVQGPRAADVLAPFIPDIDLGAMPHMSVREGHIGDIPIRLFRVSFTGELGFEINVPAGHGQAIWDAVWKAGQAHGLQPYGTEAMHVLRAEKGYIVVGQDSDGTVTPDDLGLGWAIGKAKPDFVGKRSLARPDIVAPGRKQLIGLLPADPTVLLEDGAQIAVGRRAIGHVTSSYRSAALGRTFALALVKGGRDRIGERLYAPVGGRLVPVTVASPVLYDPEGARRDG